MKKNKIIFDKNTIWFILEIFNKTVDKNNYIIDKETKEKVLTIDGEEIKIDELGGVVKGKNNEICFIKGDLSSLMDYVNLDKIEYLKNHPLQIAYNNKNLVKKFVKGELSKKDLEDNGINLVTPISVSYTHLTLPTKRIV